MLLQNAIADALNNTEWAFPLAECVHIGGFAVGIGSIALVDFRMLNLGLRHETCRADSEVHGAVDADRAGIRRVLRFGAVYIAGQYLPD